MTQTQQPAAGLPAKQQPAKQAEQAKPSAPAQQTKTAAAPDIKHLVRIANTDLDGKKAIGFVLADIKGVGIPLAHAACRKAGINVTKKAGALTEAETKRVEEIIKNPVNAGLPGWLTNRRRDPETGQDRHLLSGELQFTRENDIRTMKKIRSYKGVRHMLGQPVRGQRTRSHFRKNKGKVMGVRRSAAAKSSSGGKT